MTAKTTSATKTGAGAQSARKTIQIFRAGTHRSVTGRDFTFSEGDIGAIAAAYDPELHEAPVVVGHPKLDAPAYGWVRGLRAEGDALFADVELTPVFAETVADGHFKKVSAAFYDRDQAGNPTPGQIHLRHLGFLGAKPPAVKGLASVAFSEKLDPDRLLVIEAAFGESEGRDAEDISALSRKITDIAGLFRRVRTYLVDAEGEERAQKVLPDWDLEYLGESSAQLTGRADERARMARSGDLHEGPAYSEGPDPKTKEAPMSEQDKADAAKRQAEIEAREKRLQEREAAFAEEEATRQRDADMTFAEGLVKAGRLPAAQKDNLTAVLASLPRGEDAAMEFAETDDKGKATKVKKTPHAAFREMVEAAPQLLSFGEAAPAGGPTPAPSRMTLPGGYQADPERAELHEKALAYAEENGVPYIEAVEKLQLAG